jgi:hypothetical protein
MKRVHKYRVGYSIYRRNVPLNDVVYGEKDGRVEYVQIEDEESRIEGLLFDYICLFNLKFRILFG